MRNLGRIFFLGLLTATAGSLAAKEYSFSEILALSKESPAVREAEAGAAESSARARKEGKDYMDLVLGYSYMDLSTGGSGLSSEMAFHKFTLKQGLPTSGRLKAAGSAARFESSMAETNVSFLLRERKRQIATMVSSYRWGREIAANRRREVDFLKRLYESAQAQYVGGLLNFSSLNELEIKRIQAENMALDMEKEAELRLLEIQSLAGLRDPDFRLKAGEFPLDFSAASHLEVEPLYQAYLRDNPERGMRSFAIERRKALRDAAKSSFFPDIELMTEFDYRPAGGSTFGVGLEINLPALSFGAKTAGVAAADQAGRVVRERQSQADLEAYNRIRALLLRIDSQLRQLNLLAGGALKAGEENISHMIQEFQVRKADLDSVYGSVMMTFEIRNQYYGLADRIYADLFELESLTGERKYIF